ncbi:MAG: ABC transporter permease [Chloroflexi bacterium]|nr:ABC transporter permease [Chloroflexota bacterium]
MSSGNFAVTSGFSQGDTDPRLPVAVINQDGGDPSTSSGLRLSLRLVSLLENSEVIAVSQDEEQTLADYEKSLAKGDLAGILTIPAGYTETLLTGNLPPLILEADTAQTAGTTVQGEILAAATRLVSAVQTALIVGETSSAFTPAFEQALAAWEEPPIRIETASAALVETEEQPSTQVASLGHTAPGMMLQFGIASLLTSATVVVNERKTRSLQRLLTTATRRPHILLGHFLAIFVLLFAQFLVLMVFGQLILKVDYLRVPGASLLVALASSLCIAALGLLIGVLAKSEEQAIAFSLIPMFIFSGLGGAWVPLEFTGATFQAIGHITPIAWAMDGFKNITVRLLGLESVLLPSAALAGYALLFFLLAVWRFRRVSE